MSSFGVRLARAAPSAALPAVAVAVGVSTQSLRRRLRRLDTRGRCDQTAITTATTRGPAAARFDALAHRACPPQTARLLAEDRSWILRTAVALSASTSAWRARETLTGSAALPRVATVTAPQPEIDTRPSCAIAAFAVGLAETNNGHHIARDSDAPPAAVAAVASNPPYLTSRLAVVDNHRCHSTVLAAIAASTADTQIYTTILANPNCPPGLVTACAADPPSDARVALAAHKAVVSNPNCPPVALDDIVSLYENGEPIPTHSRDILAAAASSPHCSRRSLAQMAASRSVPVRAAAAAHPALPADHLKQLAADRHEDVRTQAARNPVCDETLLQQLADDPHHQVRAAVAAHDNCTPDLLLRLATAPQHWVAHNNIVQNRRCPPAVFEMLAEETLDDRRECAAEGRNCPPEILEHLMQDRSPKVRSTAAANPNAGAALIAQSATSPDESRRAGAAANPATEQAALMKLTADPSAAVRRAVVCNPRLVSLPAQRICNDPDRRVRFSAVYSPVATRPLLKLLAEDTDSDVREAASERLTLKPPTKL